MSRLKLFAMDNEDLQVLSACCQDAVLQIGDMEFYPAENRFALAMNRFVWEKADPGAKSFERRQAVLHFNRVNSVKLQGIDRTDRAIVLSLLSIKFEETDSPAGAIELVFAGDGAVRLEVECLEVQLTDQLSAWQTQSRPDHEDEEDQTTDRAE